MIVEDKFKAELGDWEDVWNDYLDNSGREVRGIIERLMYPTIEVLKYLKRRSPYVSFHDKSQLELLDLAPILLFDHTSPTGRPGAR